MSKFFDVIVLGLGAHGSAAIYHLSKTGQKVLGIDQFKPPHKLGSSHGQSRIIRQAYHENPFYVPLVKEAYNLWDEIEKNSGKKLLLKTGGLTLGAEDSSVVKGAGLSATTHGIPFEFLDNKNISERFPALHPSGDTVGLLEKDAGILFPELCIQAHLKIAEKNSAVLQYNEAVLSIIPVNDYVEIVTGKNRYQAAKVIISAGAWIKELVPELYLPLTIERQVLYWLKDKNDQLPDYFLPACLPIYIWEYLPGKIFYGFPNLGDGIKIAFHHAGEQIIPQTLTPAVSQTEINNIIAVAEKYLNLDPVFNYANTCMYTNTPDENFILDFHPANKNIIVASPCSGHGFKFSSLIGKIVCDMAIEKPVTFDIQEFNISRFSQHI